MTEAEVLEKYIKLQDEHLTLQAKYIKLQDDYLDMGTQYNNLLNDNREKLFNSLSK